MPIRDFQDLTPRTRPSASELNRQSRAVEQLLNIQSDGVQQDNTGTSIRPPDQEVFEVLITGVDTSQAQARYSGIEQQRDDQGVPSNKPGGLTFAVDYLPLYERNNVSNVPTGKIVEARQGDGAFYLFTSAVGGGGGTTIYVEADAIEFNGSFYHPGDRQTYDGNAQQWLVQEPVYIVSNDPDQRLKVNSRYQADKIGTTPDGPELGISRDLYTTDHFVAEQQQGFTGTVFVVTSVSCLGDGDLQVTTTGLRFENGSLKSLT